MIPTDKLVELASLYEEYEYAPDPTVQSVRRAKLIFDSECRRLYEAESPSIRSKMNVEKYTAAFVIPDVLRQLSSPPPAPNI